VEAVTNGARDGNRLSEVPAVIRRPGETDAIAADPDNVHKTAIDRLLSLGVLASAPLADLGNRPDMRPGRTAEYWMPGSGSTGRGDSGHNRGCQRRTEGSQARQKAPELPRED